MSENKERRPETPQANQSTGQPAVSEAAPDEHNPARQRRTRRPFGSRQQKMAWPPIPGFHLHWFNADPGRVDEAKAAGYDHVEDSDGKPVKRVVGTERGGGPLLAYLMKIPLEWYNEDQAASQSEIDKVDKAIRRGQVQGPVSEKDSDAFYATAQGRRIQFEEGTGRAAAR